MRPDLNNASLGVVGGVAAVASTLRMLGVHYQILPERSAPLSTFRGRNVVLFGDPINSFSAAQLLNRSRLTVAVNAGTNRLVIRDRTAPPSAPPVFSRSEGRPGEPAEVFGLLTVMPTAGAPGQNRRTLIVSGISNAGIHGVMEFFTSTESLQDLKNHFVAMDWRAFPSPISLSFGVPPRTACRFPVAMQPTTSWIRDLSTSRPPQSRFPSPREVKIVLGHSFTAK